MNSSATKLAYTVFECTIGDVEDPEIYVAQPLYEWQQTEAGRWVMEHALETPSYSITTDYNTYGYRCRVLADFDERTAVEYCLRWHKF